MCVRRGFFLNVAARFFYLQNIGSLCFDDDVDDDDLFELIYE